ncbi:MAG: hypothetical protein CSA39_07205 [Flavobacteriales bacterium]|nr:MAG: hypothetical protein CR989_02255 [Flavobacteriales bacterium]PIE48554.1 MAG: hypothetical protein CSA39_07205 [Flavobacteriales bacterium]
MSRKLTLDCEFDHDYTLIAINSTLEEYRLVYFLNKFLKIKLSCESGGLSFNDKNCAFGLYTYYCPASYSEYVFLANKQYFANNIVAENVLFTEQTHISYLIEEKKDVDFFLKINDDYNQLNTLNIINKIKEIPGVVTTFSVAPDSLKSKDYLIF